MTGIYFNADVRLKAYSSISKGGKTTIKIELETTDHYSAASVNEQLDMIDQAQRKTDKPSKNPAPAPVTRGEQP